MSRLRERFLDCEGLDLESAEHMGRSLAELQRDIMFWFGDLARYAQSKWPDTWQQVFPEWVSPGLIARASGVTSAYPNEEDRAIPATYSQYMQNVRYIDRLQRLAEIVDKGLTTDESRAEQKSDKARWLLAVDCNYFLHRFWHSGAGVEAATGVASWIKRTVERLKTKGLTDVACCFDSHENHRKQLTDGWDDKYKGNRGPKDPELAHQIQLVRELLTNDGFCCMSVDGYESDDCIASCARQFDGKVTILSQDKDLKQCLSGKCNMLLDVVWSEDDTSGDMLPEYKWFTAKTLMDDTGVTPGQFPDLQCLMGDSSDCIKGAPGIGETGSINLMKEFGSVEACIKAAHDEDPRLLNMKRGKVMAKGLLELEPKLDITRKLVTLVDTLDMPTLTRI